MASAQGDEIEDFVTCPVCLCEFDSEIRKPKFLACSHTLCFQCLKEIQKTTPESVTCPLCRSVFAHSGDIKSLPNNCYVLQMLKMKLEEPAKKVTTSTTIKDLEALIGLKEQFLKTREKERSVLEKAASCRKETQAHLSLVLRSLKLLEMDIKSQKDANDQQLSDITSLLERRAKEDANDLTSVEGSSPEDTLETLRDKMDESLKHCQHKLSEAKTVLKEINEQKKSRIAVRLYDDKNRPVPMWEVIHNGFAVNWPEEAVLTHTKRDFLLLNNLVFSVQKRNKASASPPVRPPNTSRNQLGHATSMPSVFHQPPPVAKEPIMILRVQKYGQLVGRIHIKLRPQYVQQLIQLYSKSTTILSETVGKALAGVFVVLPVCDPGFKILDHNDEQARRFLDVGIATCASDVGFNLLFPLQHYHDRKNDVHTSLLKSIGLLGRVVDGMEAIVNLSWTQKNQRQGYSFVLEPFQP